MAKCPACTPAALIRHEFAQAKKTAQAAGSCAPMQRVLAKMRPVVAVEAAGNPKRARLIFREMLSKENQVQKMCQSMAAREKVEAAKRLKAARSSDILAPSGYGMDGLRRSRRRRRR